MLQISLHYLVILRYQNYELGWAKLNTCIWRPRGTGVESTSRGDGTVFPCPVVSTSRPWASRRLSKQTNWCEVEVVFNERTIRPENRLGLLGKERLGTCFRAQVHFACLLKIWETIILSANETKSLFLRSNKPFLRRTVARSKMKLDFQIFGGPPGGGGPRENRFLTEWSPYLPGCVTAYGFRATLCACNTVLHSLVDQVNVPSGARLSLYSSFVNF